MITLEQNLDITFLKLNTNTYSTNLFINLFSIEIGNDYSILNKPAKYCYDILYLIF